MGGVSSAPEESSVGASSSARIAEQFCFVFGSDNLQEVSFVSAFEKAGAALRVLDEVVFRFLELQSVHIITGIDIAAVEKELMRRDRKQRFRQLLDFRQ